MSDTKSSFSCSNGKIVTEIFDKRFDFVVVCPANAAGSVHEETNVDGLLAH